MELSATAEMVREETTDNLCQPWEHKLFRRFQVGPSASASVWSIWAYVVETTDFSRLRDYGRDRPTDRPTGGGGGAVERERGERTT